MRASDRVQGLIGGALAGLASGLFGVGGGLLLVPILTRRFHCSQHQAHGTSLAVIGLTALAGVVVYAWNGHVQWTTAAGVALASAVTARFGARLATRLSSIGLARAFALFLVAVAIRLLLKTPNPSPVSFHHGWLGFGIDLALGSAVGILAGFMGVGGGILAVPVFTLALGMTQQAAQGTSLAVIMVSGPAGTFEHARHGNVVWNLVPALALGSLVGAPLSSWAAQLIPQVVLVRSFAVFLIVNAVLTWLRPPIRRREA
ncbi:MAG: sulfite exporter TauE/SafE family protein [Candidatus Eisenbacteria bacterium]|uniref:Probable membrane transporter protein n=1 Tax=Eiseniibacteriota bacterium TaxID=2212470 RepID=A0A538U761_UNCEI|nr:MAG: sulfite exporter TauE/SafE family protein [Candidatus Eisenbacteria bacterium]